MFYEENILGAYRAFFSVVIEEKSITTDLTGVVIKNVLRNFQNISQKQLDSIKIPFNVN